MTSQLPARRPELNLHSAVGILLEAGHLGRDDVLRGLRVTDASRRNRSVRVETHDGGFHLKQSEPSLGRDRHKPLLEREARLVEAFQVYPAFTACRKHAPRFVAFDEPDGILVTRLVSPCTSVTKLHLNGGKVFLAEDVAESAGRALARFHAAGERLLAQRPDHLPAGMPLAQSILTPPPPDAPADSHARIAMFQVILRRHGIPFPLPTPSSEGAPPTLVHGDGRWDNYLVTDGGGEGKDIPIILIDWELAQKGDAAYDVAAWISEYYRFLLIIGTSSGGASLAGAMTRASIDEEAMRVSAQAFLTAYCAERDVGDRGAFIGRVRARLPHLLLLIAWESSRQAKPDPDDPHWSTVELVRVLAALVGDGIPWIDAIR